MKNIIFLEQRKSSNTKNTLSNLLLDDILLLYSFSWNFYFRLNLIITLYTKDEKIWILWVPVFSSTLVNRIMYSWLVLPVHTLPLLPMIWSRFWPGFLHLMRICIDASFKTIHDILQYPMNADISPCPGNSNPLYVGL